MIKDVCRTCEFFDGDHCGYNEEPDEDNYCPSYSEHPLLEEELRARHAHDDDSEWFDSCDEEAFDFDAIEDRELEDR